MTTTTEYRAEPAEAGRDRAPAPADGDRLPRLRVAGMREALVGLLLVVLSVVAFEAGAQARENRRPVLALTRDVPEGRPLRDEDLVVVRAAVDGSRVRLVAAERRREVIGRSPVAPLPAGTFLADATLGDRVGPAPGEVLLSVPVDPDRLPRTTRIGDRIRIIDTGDPGASASTLVDGARVYAVREGSGYDDLVTVDLIVPTSSDGAVAAAVAEDRVGLVLMTARR